MLLPQIYQDGRSVSSIAKCHGIMHQIMNKAEANDMVRRRPVRFINTCRIAPTRMPFSDSIQHLQRLKAPLVPLLKILSKSDSKYLRR